MIYLITDILEGEPDILTPINKKVLYIRYLDGELLSEVHPIDYWTHDSLMEVVNNFEEHDVCANGADAFLGDEWIGSTEC